TGGRRPGRDHRSCALPHRRYLEPSELNGSPLERDIEPDLLTLADLDVDLSHAVPDRGEANGPGAGRQVGEKVVPPLVRHHAPPEPLDLDQRVGDRLHRGVRPHRAVDHAPGQADEEHRESDHVPPPEMATTSPSPYTMLGGERF